MNVQTKTLNTGWPLHSKRSGWLGTETTKEELSFELNENQVQILRKLAADNLAAGRRYTDVTRDQFCDALLDPFLASMAEALKSGKGLVFLRNIPIDGLSLDEIRMIFWGIGTHFGMALSQSVVGDKMGDVTPRPGSSRGYTGDQELGLHTDFTEIGVLLCIQGAKAGGENIFVSSLALWDIIERERPDYIDVLKRGFMAWRMDEHREHQDPVTPYHVPVFAETEGLRSVYWSWLTADATARFLGAPLSKHEADAIRFLCSVLDRDELRFRSQLERGEAVFFNNFEVLHSRTHFTQWEDPAKTRHLLRLWLQCEQPRPIRDEMKIWRNPSGLLGRDPDPRYADQSFVKLSENDAALFMKDYFADFYNGIKTSEELMLERLGTE